MRKVTQIEIGKSTLGAMKIWMDQASGDLNKEERGMYLGAFDTGDQILVIYKDGSYELNEMQITNRYTPKDIEFIGKFDSKEVISAIYYDGDKGNTMVKRFVIETTSQDQKFPFISDHRSSKLYMATVGDSHPIEYGYMEKKKKQTQIIKLEDFIDVKGWKSLGNKLHSGKLISVKPIDKESNEGDADEDESEQAQKFKTGDSIEFDLGSQKTIFDIEE